MSVDTSRIRTVTVELGDRRYPILIGDGLLNNKDLLREYIKGNQLMVVTNETIAPLYLSLLMEALEDRNIQTVVLPDGEQYKTLDEMNNIITALLAHHFNRDCCLLALGGGVIGDITGFAAACYQRGVDFIQIPTTILAQVDSSVGGKTAVNHPRGKNMIGAFHQPLAVIADTSVLATLDDRELKAGLAEVIKYGLIMDEEFFNWLEANIQSLLARDPDNLIHAIEQSCKDKAAVVAEDEREAGLRAILNLGHTFGHAIETALSYKDWLHGEAVALGMLMAADLSRHMGWIKDADQDRIESILVKTGLPVKMPEGITPEQMLENMAVDKKARAGKLNLVLLESIGKAIVTHEFDQDKLTETLNRYATT